MSSLRVGPSESFAEGGRRTVREFRRGLQPRVRSPGCHPCASDHPRVSPRGGVGPSESFAEGGVGPSESFAEGYSLGYANQGVILARRTIREFRRGGRRTVREFRRGGRPTVREFRRGLQPRVRSPGCHPCASPTIREFRRGGASDRPRVSPRGAFRRGGVGPSESFAEGYSLGYAHQGVILARRTIREFRRGGVGPSESFAEGGRRTVREFRRGLQPRVRSPGCHPCASGPSESFAEGASDRPRVSPRATA